MFGIRFIKVQPTTFLLLIASAFQQLAERAEKIGQYYTVREPFPSKTSSASIVFGQINSQYPLRLTSQMPDYGVIFSDGIEHDFLEFNSGTQAIIAPADKRGHIVL